MRDRIASQFNRISCLGGKLSSSHFAGINSMDLDFRSSPVSGHAYNSFYFFNIVYQFFQNEIHHDLSLIKFTYILC